MVPRLIPKLVIYEFACARWGRGLSIDTMVE
jgi:hypothetical protein